MVAIAPGIPLAQRVVPSSGSTAMSTFGPLLLPDFLADEEHRRLVALAFADHDGAIDRHLVEFAPHGIDGSWSAAIFLPWPRKRAAGTAARSMTRRISSGRKRSSSCCGGTATI